MFCTTLIYWGGGWDMLAVIRGLLWHWLISRTRLLILWMATGNENQENSLETPTATLIWMSMHTASTNIDSPCWLIIGRSTKYVWTHLNNFICKISSSASFFFFFFFFVIFFLFCVNTYFYLCSNFELGTKCYKSIRHKAMCKVKIAQYKVGPYNCCYFTNYLQSILCLLGPWINRCKGFFSVPFSFSSGDNIPPLTVIFVPEKLLISSQVIPLVKTALALWGKSLMMNSDEKISDGLMELCCEPKTFVF